MNQRILALSAGLLVSSCSTSTLEVNGVSEAEELARTEHLLGARLQETFGSEARLQRVFEKNGAMTLGVALEPTPADSDAIAPMAVARYDAAKDELRVLAKEAEYREARTLPGGELALVSQTGELKVATASGEERVIAHNVRGDVQPIGADGSLALTLRGETEDDGETAIAVARPDGVVTILADSEGVDDRPSVAPDGKTVLFVSGRTGIASLWRTTVDGSAPVQLTNAHIEAGVERTGEPEGFIPPPIRIDRLEWVSADVVRYDAGDGEYWEVNVRTGEGHKAGGVQ